MHGNCLKVLFWVSPVTEMAWPLQKMPWLKVFVPRIQTALKAARYDIESTVVMSTDIAEELVRQAVRIDGRLVAMSQSELLDDFRYNALSETIRYQETAEQSEFFSHLGRLVREKLGTPYEPDVVISFAPAPFFSELYPKAVLLYHEYGIFSRSPYPETYYFDPRGETVRNFVVSVADEINAQQPESIEFIEELVAYRRRIVGALRSNGDISNYFSGLRKSYRRLLLVPLGFEGFADARVNFPYQTQMEFVEHILDTVDDGTAVLLTQHPLHRALPDETIDVMKASHPNLLDETFNVANFSQVAIAYCDACITQSSSLAYQTAFLGKYLVTVGGFCAGIADGHSVADLPRIYDRLPVSRDNFFVWVIRHHVTDAESMPRHLHRLVEAWRGNPPKEVTVASWPDGLSLDEFRQRLRKWSESVREPEYLERACATVFFDLGTGFSSDNIRFILRVSDDFVSGEILLPAGCKRLRFDPYEGHAIAVSELVCSCDGAALEIASHNGQQTPDGWLFLTNDPQFFFNVPDGATCVTVEARFKRLPEPDALMRCEQARQALHGTVAALEGQLVAARSEQDRLHAELTRVHGELFACRLESAAWKSRYDEISNSTCWRMTKPVRWILDTLKRLKRRVA